MRKRFYKSAGHWNARIRGYSDYANYSLCTGGVSRLFHIPKSAKYLDVVFTKQPQAESMTLVLKKDLWESNYIVLKETKAALPFGAKYALRCAYRAGYRYLHIEYYGV